MRIIKVLIGLFDFLTIISIAISVLLEEGLPKHIKSLIEIGGGWFLSIALGLVIFYNISIKQINEKNNRLNRVIIIHILFLLLYEFIILVL